jgi:hypothetical protein
MRNACATLEWEHLVGNLREIAQKERQRDCWRGRPVAGSPVTMSVARPENRPRRSSLAI